MGVVVGRRVDVGHLPRGPWPRVDVSTRRRGASSIFTAFTLSHAISLIAWFLEYRSILLAIFLVLVLGG